MFLLIFKLCSHFADLCFNCLLCIGFWVIESSKHELSKVSRQAKSLCPGNRQWLLQHPVYHRHWVRMASQQLLQTGLRDFCCLCRGRVRHIFFHFHCDVSGRFLSYHHCIAFRLPHTCSETLHHGVRALLLCCLLGGARPSILHWIRHSRSSSRLLPSLNFCTSPKRVN